MEVEDLLFLIPRNLVNGLTRFESRLDVRQTLMNLLVDPVKQAELMTWSYMPELRAMAVPRG